MVGTLAYLLALGVGLAVGLVWFRALARACAFAFVVLGLLRIGVAWLGMQELYDLGHVRSGLVPPPGQTVLLRLFIAAQGLAVVLVLPPALDAFASRRTRSLGLAMIVLLSGAVVAFADLLTMQASVRGTLVSWIRQMLVDDVAYAVFSLLGVIVLARLVAAAQRERPPADDARAKVPAAEVKRLRRTRMAITIATLFVMSVGVVRAEARWRREGVSSGDLEIATGTGPTRVSKDHRFRFWMPEGETVHESEETLGRARIATKRWEFARGQTALSIEYRRFADGSELSPGSLATLCVPTADFATAGQCDAVRGDVDERVIQDPFNRVFVLRARPAGSPASRHFLESFSPRVPKDRWE